jgi:large subunit ribosomal protein L28
MARCELTGKSPQVKNLVSHSNIKTKSRNFPNVQSKSLFSRTLNRLVSLKIATTTIRTVESRGGVDVFLLNAPDQDLSRRALALKNQIRRKIRGDGEVKEVKVAAPKMEEAPKAKKPARKTATKKTGAKK